jgi:putative NIF3 family GTP cyclohydrolase 1 type 2
MPTIQQSIDSILKLVQVHPKAGTVDTLKLGDPECPVRGVVVTFMATRGVLQRAFDLGANFVITHEPTFYNHRDEVAWLGTDEVCAAKRKWIEEHDLAIWRFHDGPHSLQPDGIDAGMIQRLGWKRDSAGNCSYARES